MMRKILLPCLVFVAILAFAASSASASPQAVSVLSAAEQNLIPGNYCVSCHLADDPRLVTVTEWKGGIGREVNSPCPAATKIHEELYYTERMLLMIDRAKAQVGTRPEKQQSQLDKYTQQYSRLLDEPVTSLDAFVAAAQTTRYRLNKIYASLNQTAETSKKRTVLVYAGIATLIVLGSLVWGLYNTRFIHMGTKKPHGLLKPGIFVLAVLIFFALPVFRVPAAEVVQPTSEQQEAQSILDTADRATTAADRAQARAWMLARLGAVWNEMDPTQAKTTLEESLAAVEQARENEEALWGQSLSVQEAMIGVLIDMENANLIAGDLNAARARAWSIPLIAVELNKVDPAQAMALLAAEQSALQSQMGRYRDLQLRSVALAWAEIEPSEAMPACRDIRDAAIRAWTLRELAVILNDTSLFDLAAQAAREVEDPVQRARLLREVAVVSGEECLFDEAYDALDGVTGASLAYALSDLAAASGDVSLLVRIDSMYADAQAAGHLRLGEYSSAWGTSANLIDPYERGRAQAAIASAWEEEYSVLQIEVPSYRDLALRNVIRETGNVALTDSIQSAYYRVQALTAHNDFDNALALAEGLGDSYPLVELALELVKENPQAALTLVEKMTREADKAVVLNAIAASTNDPAIFEQAQGMALAARVQGDVLAPSATSLDLANLLWQVNTENAQSALRQAYEAALRISIK